jgi:starvation-inducible DNA-binding protein
VTIGARICAAEGNIALETQPAFVYHCYVALGDARARRILPVDRRDHLVTAELIVQDVHPTLRHEERQGLGADLQGMLVDLTDLALIGKQLHWNIQGPHFRSLHLQLDELIDAWRELGDRVAERAVALGVAPDGRAQTVAQDSELPPPPAGPLPTDEAIAYLTQALVGVITRARKRMEQTAEYDDVTNDLLIEVVGQLEQQHWMVSVQLRD